VTGDAGERDAMFEELDDVAPAVPMPAAAPSRAAATAPSSGDAGESRTDPAATPADGARDVSTNQEPRRAPDADAEEEEEEPDPFTDAENRAPFQLGLGDFIFYSVLVGRASTYNYVAWLSAYVAIIAGLISTLCSLMFLRGKVPALPALPISIFGGVAAYFLARFVTVPFCYFVAYSATTA
jgi:hypothetical protein